jgi:predicted DCC family thiol-disulfide oxidoreductase YuxK
MPTSMPDDIRATRRTTVYFDGACPLCNAEIACYRRQKGAQALQFVDVSAATALDGMDLTREDALKRFHIRNPDGTLISGAAAFVAIWRLLPRWSWAARLAALPGVLVMLEALYRLFLKIRPAIARFLQVLGIGKTSGTR